uniref:Protein kinase domain-containing protein n=1 Tax=Spongospora subterranea TaxID=70186 RepID=A0A0H5QM18_9EUKA|eukprot:CRZ02636.1 hypothetical protein [Spongospora subterranea]
MVQKTEFRKTTDKFGIKYVNQYRIGKPLGQGTSSRVVTGTDDRGNQRALKIFSKARLRKQSSAFRPVNESVSSGNRGQTEILHLSRLGFEENAHINIIKLYEVMDDPSKDNMALVVSYSSSTS